MPPASYALLSARQQATPTAFNQPLNFNTSSVTDMKNMFAVRSARALPLIPSRVLACALLAPAPPHALLPLAPRVALHELRCGLAVRDGVQPAAEIRHVQRHNHERHAFGPLRACPAPDSQSGPPPARCLRRRRPTPSQLPARVSTVSFRMPSSRLGSKRRRSTSR